MSGGEGGRWERLKVPEEAVHGVFSSYDHMTKDLVGVALCMSEVWGRVL